MNNPYRTQRERAAYSLGYGHGVTAGKAEASENGDAPKVLTREQVLAMSPSEIDDRWPEVSAALAAGLPEGEDDDE
jgi:hypothetical protein